MSETFNTGDIVEITATGMIEVVYGDDKYLVRVHGETVPMFASQMSKAAHNDGSESSELEAVKEHIRSILTKQGFEDAIAMTRAKSELRDKLWKVLTEN